MSSLEANRKIIAKLSMIVEQCPDWRFQQILYNVGISSRFGADLWYEESEKTLQKLDATVQIDNAQV